MFMNIVFSNIEYQHKQLYYWSTMFIIICAMDLCNVFYNENSSLPILINEKNIIHKWLLIIK
jgi:hypothetical protein